MNKKSKYFMAKLILLGCIFITCKFVSAAELKTGALNAVSFKGPITGESVKYMIYLPPDYNSSDEQYAVIYHLHGLGGDETSDNKEVVKAHKRAVAAGIVKPMIIVFPNGHDNSMWGDSKSGHKRVETNVIRELIPHVDATYRTRSEAGYRVIQGFSMGGYGAMLYASKYPELFGICINYDGALHDEKTLSTRREAIFKEIFEGDKKYFKEYSPWANMAKNYDIIHEQVAIRSVIGSLSEYNKKFHQWLLEVDVMQEYVETGLGHDLGAILEKEWENDYYFIAEHLGGGGESGKLRDGKSHYRVFEGPITGKRIEYNIYLPEGYVNSGKRYPVIYHLHGLAVNQDCDDDMVPVGLEKAVKAGIVEPMIVVFANGYRDAWWADSFDGKKPAATNVIRELIPHIDTKYRTKADRKHRVIQGFSMGGYGAMAYITKHPDLFKVCVAYDGAYIPDENLGDSFGDLYQDVFGSKEERVADHSPWQNAIKNADAIRKNSAIRMISAAFGEMNEAYCDHLKKLDIPVNYVQANCDHNMYCMTDEQWEATYKFIAEHLGL